MEQIILWLALLFVAAVLGFLAREDWIHLSRPARRTIARVIGHAEHEEDGARLFTPLLEFTDEEGRTVQVKDIVYSGRRHPATNSDIEITHPHGMPERACIPRPWLRMGIYAGLIYLAAVLIGRLAGWLSAGGGDVAGL